MLTDTQPSVEALYRADAPRLWRALYAYAGDAEIASDAVNEAYVQVIRRGTAVRDPAAWVWRSAFRIARGALQARRSGDQALAPETATSGELTVTEIRISCSRSADCLKPRSAPR